MTKGRPFVAASDCRYVARVSLPNLSQIRMMDYQVEITVVPRRGILDPQGKAVHGALTTLGFSGIDAVHVGRLIRIEIAAGSSGEAEERATAMCRQLLANPVTEDFEVRVIELEGSSR